MGQAPWLDDLRQKSVSLRPGTWAVYRNTANPKFVTAPVISDSPAVSVTEISDPASADAGLELIELDAVQLESQPLRARRVIVRLGDRQRALPRQQPAPAHQHQRAQGSARLCHLRPAGAGDGERGAGPPRYDVGRCAGIRGPIRGGARLGEHHLPAPARGDRAPSDGAPVGGGVPSSAGGGDAPGQRGDGVRALRLGEAAGGDRRRAARPVQRTGD